MSKKGGHRSGKRDRSEKRWQKVKNHDEVEWQSSTGQEDEVDDDDDLPITEEIHNILSPLRIFMWEFGQNDARRDSGSKLCRLGYARKLKVGYSFNGIVLSSEASKVVSKDDLAIIRTDGIAGINCSWNRLTEIPFSSLGKASNQRKLPLLLAANTVNYGKPYKMNTAEALAASLYIAGLKVEAAALMYPFSYGQEFLRINTGFLDLYADCESEAAVASVSLQVERLRADRQNEKDKRKEEKRNRRNENNIGGYMDEMDLPPMESDGEYEEEEEVTIVQEGQADSVFTALTSSAQELTLQESTIPPNEQQNAVIGNENTG